MTTFRLKHLRIDTQREHIVFIHAETVRLGNLGFHPLDRVRVIGAGAGPEIIGILNFCADDLVAPDEIGLSDDAFHDLGLPDGAPVRAALAPAPRSVDRVRDKLQGTRLRRADFDAILRDVVRHRYSKVELTMFVLACALRSLDQRELVDLTRAMIATGTRLDFGRGPVADKHCIGGVPGNRTTLVIVPIVAALGVTIPKTSSRAITSPAGTADTMAVLADVALPPDRLRRVVREAGACIAWGGALALAPADDILITVERPMELDTEAQMVASILAKKKTAGATHAVIEIPVGATAKVRSAEAAARVGALFRAVAKEIDLHVQIVTTEAHGPVGRGIGPRLEALDVLGVLARAPGAPRDLREKSLLLASALLEMVGAAAPGGGHAAASEALDNGAALRAFERIVAAQGPCPLPDPARHQHPIPSPRAGRITEIDCWEIARVAKQAGAPANPAAGVYLHHTVGDDVNVGDPLFEIHAQTDQQLDFARAYVGAHPNIVRFQAR